MTRLYDRKYRLQVDTLEIRELTIEPGCVAQRQVRNRVDPPATLRDEARFGRKAPGHFAGVRRSAR